MYPPLDTGPTFHTELAATTHAQPDSVFLRCGATSMTYAELDDASARIASRLLNMGLRPGDRIAIAALNQPEWLAVFFAATRIGVVVVMLNARYREAELDYMLNHSGARGVFTLSKLDTFDYVAFYSVVAQQIPMVEHIVYLDDDYSDLASTAIDTDALHAAEAAVSPTNPAAILYTSGTTGRPKGAVLTHASMLAAARGELDHLDLTRDDVLVGNMPLNHVGGITCTITAALLARASVVLMPTFSPADALETVAASRATIFAGVPAMYAMMLAHPDIDRHDLDSIRVAIIGGANADPSLCTAITARFRTARLSNLYGLSESSGACLLSAVGDDPATVSSTLGVPIPGVEVRIADVDGADVTPGADGELLIRGAGVAAGYWQMPDETASTFLPDGWLATGDIVTATPDGHLVLRGRSKEMYIQGGYNVYPIEVENILTTHPAVAMAAGIGIPDPVLGEIGRYYVLTRPDHDVTADELIAHCRQRLADYKAPKQIVLVDDLPMTPSGKVAKSQLQQSFSRKV